MKTFIIHSVLAMSLFGLSTAQAQTATGQDHPHYFGYAKFGTQGAGLGAGYGINERFAVRLGANSGATDKGSRSIDDNRYDFSRKSGASVEALLDWYPLPASGFRLSGGLMLTDADTRLTARPSDGGTYTLNGNSYSAEDLGELTATVRPARLSPYLGVGWESARLGQRGVQFFADAGVFHLRTRSATLQASSPSTSSQLQADLRAEEARIKAVNDIGFNASIGLRYTF